MSRLPWLLVVALMAPALAGCVGQDAPAQAGPVVVAAANTSEAAAAAGGGSSRAGSIDGVVLDTALEPLSGASVRDLRDDSINTSSDAAGAFHLADLDDGTHDLVITAEGHETKTIRVSTRRGTVTQVEIQLDPLVIVVPYHQTRELAGYLSCAVASTATEAFDATDCAAADENHRDRFDLGVDAEAAGYVLELVWDAEAHPEASAGLVLRLETVGYGALDLMLGETSSTNGYARVSADPAIMRQYYPEGGKVRASVAIPEDGAALQLSFTLYATAFYLDPAVDGFAVASP